MVFSILLTLSVFILGPCQGESGNYKHYRWDNHYYQKWDENNNIKDEIIVVVHHRINLGSLEEKCFPHQNLKPKLTSVP